MEHPAIRRPLIALALGLAAGFLALAVGQLPLAETVEWTLYDQRVRWTADPATASRKIVMVTIDETSVRNMEPLVGRWPWPRLVHADLVDFLSRGHPKAIVYDVLFTDRDRRTGFDVGGTEWSGAESDKAFADSVARAGNVVVLAEATYEGLVGEDRQALERWPERAPRFPAGPVFERRPVVSAPYDELARAARAIGHNFFVVDPDGPVRRVVPFVRVGERAVPSLGVAGFMVAAGAAASVQPRSSGVRVGEREVPLVLDRLPAFEGAARESAGRLLVAFRGPPVLADGRGTTYRNMSFFDLFYAAQELIEDKKPSVDPNTFRDAIVFVGTTAAGLHDVFATPFGGSGKMPGSEIHATVVDQLLANRFLRPASPWTTGLLTLAAAIVAAVLATLIQVRIGLPAVGVVATGLVAGSTSAFRAGYWIPLAVPMIGIGLASFGGMAWRYFVEGREKRFVKRMFSRYLSRDVYEQLLQNPALAELGGKRRDMSVLFSDLRGFTTFSEGGQPEDIVAQLNEYFSRMVSVVFAHGGTLDKFVGDMVMALFGAPLDDEEHADHAVQTALAMCDELDKLNADWAARGRPKLAMGIGVNSGEMIAGNIGAEQVRSYTVIGDAVNLGSRLESLNKDMGTTILISEFTASRLKGRYDLRALGQVGVKGKTVKVSVFEVRRPAPAAEAARGTS